MRDFQRDLHNIFSKYKSDAPKTFSVVKIVNDRVKVVELGLSMTDVLRALEGRYRDTVKGGELVRFKVVPERV